MTEETTPAEIVSACHTLLPVATLLREQLPEEAETWERAAAFLDFVQKLAGRVVQ